MKYFIDTKFHEYQKKCLFNKPIDTIELISIGIISEDYKYAESINGGDPNKPKTIYKNREYYAICKDFDLKAAWENEWLRENVLKPIEMDLFKIHCKANVGHSLIEGKGNYGVFKNMLNKYGKTREEIAEEIHGFIYKDYLKDTGLSYPEAFGYRHPEYDPEFYAYYADYDWVVFCWLFGRMIDLPKGFPMYCIDLKQILDEKADPNGIFRKSIPFVNLGINKKVSKEQWLECITRHTNYPKKENEHNALVDAKWNYELYKFLNKL